MRGQACTYDAAHRLGVHARVRLEGVGRHAHEVGLGCRLEVGVVHGGRARGRWEGVWEPVEL